MSGWQKKVLARQEYRKKLAEDPAFVPHLGEFWGHDDRFIKDELRDDFDSHYRKSPSFASRYLKILFANIKAIFKEVEYQIFVFFNCLFVEVKVYGEILRENDGIMTDLKN
jgi:hypothetical protein